MSKRAHRLKSLSVNEISLVDAPANPGAVHLLFKRKDASMPSEADIAAARKAKDATVLDRLLTRLGLGKRGETGTVDPDIYADAAAAAIDKACEALTTSVASIMADAAITDKPAMVAKSLAEFRAFTADAASEQIEKAMRDVALITKSGKDDTMPTADEQIAALTKQVEALTREAEIAKMTDKHKTFMASLADDEAKAKFAAKTPAERDSQCAAADMKKGLTDEGTLVALTKAQSEVADLQKRIAVFEADKELGTFRKRASDIGLGDAQAETLLKASKGDAAAFEAVLGLVKSATAAARTGAVFKEFGGSSGNGTDGSARAEVNAKAEELRKSDPKISLIAARVAVRKSDLELAQREREEERQGVGAA